MSDFGRRTEFGPRIHPDIKELERSLPDVVASLDWRLFVTEPEMEKRRLVLSTRLDDLDLRAIWEAIEEKLGDIEE